MNKLRKMIVEKNVSDNIVENMLLLRNLDDEVVYNLLNATNDFEEDVYTYKNLSKGMDFLVDAIKNKEKICIRVDCDADGYLSSSVAYNCIYNILEYDDIFITIGNDKSHSIPLEKIDDLAKNDIKLVILPDSGSIDFPPLKKMVDYGMKVLILDHHIIEINDDDLKSIEENVALINNQDGNVENVHLSGTGVTYKFFKALLNELGYDIGDEFLDVVATSIVTDVCSLKDSYENRYFLNEGTKIKNLFNPLLIEIANSLKKKDKDIFTIKDLIFKISPVLNSTIRLGNIEDKELLFNALIGNEELVEHRNEMMDIPKKVRLRGQTFQNRQRTLVKVVSDIVKDKIREKNIDNDNVILYIDYDKVIDKNLRGLICNRLLDVYERPCMIGVLTVYINEETEERIEYVSGSARGIEGINFRKFCEDTGLFESLKGHNNAFGYSIRVENIPKFLEIIKDMSIDINKNIEVEKIYEEIVPKKDVQDIARYENLWCNDIECPKYFITDIKFKVSDIIKRGTSTYIFKNENNEIIKDMGAKVWFENLIEGTDEIILDVLVEFRKIHGKNKIVMINCERTN